ncbi:MAG: sodium/solute symporter [Archaeoglobales archaeon]|nr:sodium/solute symporter [Archaeoglobales archaeon]
MIVEVLVVYLLLMVGIGIYEYRRTKGFLDYYIANRQLGAILVSFSFFATYFSTAAFLGGGGYGFVAGFQWSAFLSFFHILFAILSWFLIAPPLRRIAEKEGIVTIPELFAKKFGKFAQIVTALIIVTFFELYMVSIYKGAGNLLEVMMGIDYITALLITAAVITIYTAIGGFRAVVMTDLIQGFIVFFGGVLLFVLLITSLGGFEAIENLKNVEIFGGMKGEALFEFGKLAPQPIMASGMVIPFILSLTFAISIAQLASPQLIIRFVAAKNDRVIAHGMILAPLLVGIFAICVFSIGPFGWLVIPKYSDVSNFVKNPDLVVPFITMKLFPEGVNALLLTAIIAAAMSTINSLVHVSATALVRDIVQNFYKISDKNVVRLTRLAVLLFALTPLIIAVKPFGVIVEIVGVSFSVITSAFLIPIVAALYSKKPNSKAAISSMIAATVTCILWQLYFSKTYIYPVVPGLVVSAIVYLATTIKK